MAFTSGTIWHGWSSGATDNGGGFDPTNASFATDLACDTGTGNTASPIVSSASYTFLPGDQNAWLFIPAGTNWTPGWYPIASVSGGKATLNAAVGAAVLYGTSTTGLNYQRPNGLNTVAGCGTVATPTGGTWSIDYSQQTGAGITFTDLVIDGTTNTDATSTAHPIGVNMLGNIVNVTSGTGFTPQRVQLVSIPSGVIGRFDKSLGTLGSTGGNGKLGGAIGSTSAITALTQALVAGNHVFLKGTFTLTVTTTVTVSAKGDITSGRIIVEGFNSYPGDMSIAPVAANLPVITSATNSVNLLTLNDNDFFTFRNLNLTHTATTRAAAFNFTTSSSGPVTLTSCVVDGCSTVFAGGTQINPLYLIGCEVKNTTGAAACNPSLPCYVYGCDFHDNTGDGIRLSGNTNLFIYDSIFDTNAIGINDAQASGVTTVVIQSCVIVANSSDGVKFVSSTGTQTLELSNNVIYGNGGYGLNNLDGVETVANLRINRCNAYGGNNGGGTGLDLNGFTHGKGDVALTTDPFTNQATRDFSPNSTAGGGALLRAAGFPGAYISGTTTDHRDIGIQHADAGGGGGVTKAVLPAGLGYMG